MNSAKTAAKVTPVMTLTTQVDQEWIDFVTSSSPDIFMGSYSGYWGRGVRHDKKLGWLVYEHGDDRLYTALEERNAVRMWKAGEKLSPKWHRFDADLAARSWVEGVRRYGESWYETGDGPRYDWVLQVALFGDKDSTTGKPDARYG